nr:hypothetical protein [Desulfobacterales bacterium]
MRGYRWSRLPGRIRKGERQEWVDYDLVLSGYGGDNEEGMRNYWHAIRSEIGLPNTSLKKEIIGQGLSGSRGLVKLVRESLLLDKVSDRELPQVRRIQGYLASEIGRSMGLDYSMLSQVRKRFRDYLEKDEEMKRLVARIEERLSRKKI